MRKSSKSDGKQQSSGKSWMENPKLLMRFRLERMSHGDWLISADERWRIECSAITKNDLVGTLYTIVFEGKKLMARQRINALMKGILKNNVPSMELRREVNTWGFKNYAAHGTDILENETETASYSADIISNLPLSVIDFARLSALNDEKLITDILSKIAPEVGMAFITL